ncbi:MAG: hypothetical protein WCD02_10565 [Terriglobales bacterium]
MNRILLALMLVGICSAQTKPVVLIQGNGNISIQSTGQAGAGVVGGAVVGGSAKQSTINKHDQTMEMAQNFLQSCPSIEVTLDGNATADYIVELNREGTPTIFGEAGKSQIMVLNAHKTPIFVGKKATVKNAVKSACNSVTADWQAHGRIQQPPQPTQQMHPTPEKQPALETQPAAIAPSQVVADTADIAVVMQTTAKADKYCKPETIASVLSDTISYVTSKGFKIGPAAAGKNTLMLVVDRPMSKWLEITVQGRDASGTVLWSEKVSDGGWGHLGTAGTLNTLEKVHRIIDTRLSSHPEITAAN